MSTAPTEPTHDELENLFVNNEKMDRIAAWLNRFNPIRIMGMDRMEIRHSAILAWLLDPKETHGLGDGFLKAFLGEALRGRSGRGGPTAIEVSQSDLRDAEVRREWRNMDIFIHSPRKKWAFIVENKFYATQKEGQLSRYIDVVRSIFKSENDGLQVAGVFLTLFDEEPRDKSYCAIRYSSICEMLPRLLSSEGVSISREVDIFLRHYIEVIREEAGMNDERSEMEKLAQQLYRSHKKVLDFVMEHGAATDFKIAAETLFGANTGPGTKVEVDGRDYLFGWANSRNCAFLPWRWYEAFGGQQHIWPGCESYWMGYPLICWMELIDGNDGSKGYLRLFAEVGPLSPFAARKYLIEKIQKEASENKKDLIKFQSGASDEGRRYSRFLRDNSVDIHDIYDSERIAKGMSDLLGRFSESFEAIEGVLASFRPDGGY